MNPSAGDIRQAIEATGAGEVIVLPNNKNIVLAAEQAARGLAVQVRVLPARTVPQGVAALVALNAEATLEENVDAMSEAIAAVRSGEVTLAARATQLGGVQIREGQPIGIVDGELVLAEDTVADAVRGCVRRMADGRDTTLVTLYAGADQETAATDALAESLRADFGVEVEVVDGGQPHYPYLIGVE
jgi:dihydroxyacetone kinase-like predicted kinase